MPFLEPEKPAQKMQRMNISRC